MKSEGEKLLCRLKGEDCPVQAARTVAAGLHAPALRAAEVLGAFAFDLTRARAQAVESFALSVAPALESIRHMRAHVAGAVAEIGRPHGYFMRAARRQAEEARAFADWLASLPEEEREELRRACEDAPLCPVDVNASGVEM